jgi:hypothetical protein
MSDAGLLPLNEIKTRASRAIGKVDLHGRRGVTMLSVDETEAMALLLATLGLAPTKPGDAPPADFFPHLKDR